ncbi:MAG TPA: chemotaxis protein CheD [Gemmatimonadales bacterium]|nr:chemotaxis protein CheD [Gemmatimonadales bacterium]
MTVPNSVIIKVAELRAAGADAEIATLGLGSCVAIILHDPEAKVGGMAHVLLPSRSLSSRGPHNPAKFPETAVPALVEEMVALGAQPRRLSARLVGGASMFANLTPMGAVQMGERNVVASRQALAALGIPVVAEATGGTAGRSVRLKVADGSVSVRTLVDGDRPL